MQRPSTRKTREGATGCPAFRPSSSLEAPTIPADSGPASSCGPSDQASPPPSSQWPTATAARRIRPVRKETSQLAQSTKRGINPHSQADRPWPRARKTIRSSRARNSRDQAAGVIEEIGPPMPGTAASPPGEIPLSGSKKAPTASATQIADHQSPGPRWRILMRIQAAASRTNASSSPSAPMAIRSALPRAAVWSCGSIGTAPTTAL